MGDRVLIATSFRECGHCHTRLLILKGVPALNWAQDPAGKVAVTFTHPRKARFLARGEELKPLEHRHAVHECGQVAAPEDWNGGQDHAPPRP